SPLLTTCSTLFTHPPTPEIHALSLHDALPISFLRLTTKITLGNEACCRDRVGARVLAQSTRSYTNSHRKKADAMGFLQPGPSARSEEHTSELQSRENLVCRLLLEKKKQHQIPP